MIRGDPVDGIDCMETTDIEALDVDPLYSGHDRSGTLRVG